jgi:hypothetical protein
MGRQFTVGHTATTDGRPDGGDNLMSIETEILQFAIKVQEPQGLQGDVFGSDRADYDTTKSTKKSILLIVGYFLLSKRENTG